MRAFWNWIIRVWERDTYAWVIGVGGFLVLLFVVDHIISNWPSLKDWSELRNGELLQYVSLTLGAAMAFVLAFWRSALASRQSAQSERGLMQDRFQMAIRMLESKMLAIRVGGIYALQELAQEHPKDNHGRVSKLLCAFIRHPTRARPVAADGVLPPISSDIKAAVVAVVRHRRKRLERRSKFRVDLRGANFTEAVLEAGDFSNAYLTDACFTNVSVTDVDFSGALCRKTNFSGTSFFKTKFVSANLVGANFESAVLERVDFTKAGLAHAKLKNAVLIGGSFHEATLSDADLTSATLHDVNLSMARLIDANLSGTDFRGAVGLTQRQLDQASKHKVSSPPILESLKCAETGRPLNWRNGK